MGQKVRPTGFRTGIMTDWLSHWYANKQDFSELLVEDQRIRKYIKRRYGGSGISKIKIDRAFVVASSSAGATIAAIVKTIIILARTLGMRVTVEGVETEEQVGLFAALGCDQMQGYYLGRPMPVQAIAAEILTDFCDAEVNRARVAGERLHG